MSPSVSYLDYSASYFDLFTADFVEIVVTSSASDILFANPYLLMDFFAIVDVRWQVWYLALHSDFVKFAWASSVGFVSAFISFR